MSGCPEILYKYLSKQGKKDKTMQWSLRDVVANVLDNNVVVSEFELQSRYYVHFRMDIVGKVWIPLSPPSNELDNTAIVLLQAWLWH